MAKLWYGILIAIIRPWQSLPLGFHYLWGKFLSWLMKAFRYRRDDVMINLARSFPGLKYKELKKIARQFYRNLGMIAAETVWLGGRARRKQKVFKKGIVSVEGGREVYEAFAKRSIMVLNSHAGNWELIGAYMQKLCDESGDLMSEKDVAVVYRRLHGKFSEEFFRRNRCALQSKSFDGYVESRVVMRHVVRHRNERKLYVFPNDQYPYGTAIARASVNFLNQETEVMTGGAEVAERLGMSVFYMYADRTAKGKYTVRFSKICDDAAALGKDNIIKEYYRRLEEDIRKNPSNYLWSHRRWK
ncbi:MAG: lysophospholipid acyltransferase family protein [Bacteroidales bacterium]|nr:lysophospholipid acyltransferase family protein [Bacteroidales bacterium]